MSYNIFVFWTGDNEITENRKRSIDQLRTTTEATITLVTKENLNEYILPSHPLHPAYEYLSLVHKADYLRTYFMNFHGGGYTDIKLTTNTWKPAFDGLYNSDKWINGYSEIPDKAKYPDGYGDDFKIIEYDWTVLLGNCCYICKPQTPLTQEWYSEMLALLDQKLELLKMYPASHARDHYDLDGSKYPLYWEEMLGKIFHKVSSKYKDHLMNTVPICSFSYYI